MSDILPVSLQNFLYSRKSELVKITNNTITQVRRFIVSGRVAAAY